MAAPLMVINLFLVLVTLLVFPGETKAADLESALQGLTSKSRTTIKGAIVELGELGDSKALPALEALEGGLLMVAEDRLIILSPKGDTGKDALSLEPVNLDSLTLRKPRINNAVRRKLSPAIAKLKIRSEDAETRLSATEQLSKKPSIEFLSLIQKQLQEESNENVRLALLLLEAQINFTSEDRVQRLKAIATIGEFGDIRMRANLKALFEKEGEDFVEPDPEVRTAAKKAFKSIDRRQMFIDQAANLFYGLSLGSILLLAALGLAITFGLMGVINMAHGEMLMLGAYSTYVIQNVFKSYLPDFFNWYLLAAIPIAFFVSALIGILLERLVIRHLYGRPLETLMATWGISLILIQTVRLIFGSQNVGVANPSYLSGGIQVFQGVVFPYNRISIIIFVIFVVTLVWALLQKTSLGLQVRAVTQNRQMAACMGISTYRVDMWTFGFGSGIAGLGGVALSQVGNVGPELGQFYIVDSFMVVVLGGVGKLAGTVAGALGLGIVNKFLEPMAGAVLGKIIVLVFVILFIQKRPQGMFAMKGRATDD